MYGQYLNVFRYENKKRYGVNQDGGYVVGVLPNVRYDCYISCGVANEESFTRDFLKEHTYLTKQDCFAFDGTIRDYPWQYTREITFVKKNIDPKNNNLSDLLQKYQRVFLNMDIEGGEYPWLMDISEDLLKKCAQIVIEFHGLNGTNQWGASHETKVACLKKLSNTHYIIHAHGNNYASVTNKFPSVLELTCLSKDLFPEGAPEPNDVPLPIPELDFQNNPNRQDIDLNFVPFVNLKK